MQVTTPFKEQKSVQITGLTAVEVQARRDRGEVNAYELRVGRTYWQIVRHNILNVFNIILFIMLLIVLISQDYATVLFAGFSVITNSVIGTYQEMQAKRKLQRLSTLTPQQVTVVRDGQRQTIDSHDIVLEDVIVIKPGDRLVVDGEVIKSDSLEIDESQLTGESDPVYKTEGDSLASGSFCIAGSGLMQATRIGAESTVNRLSSLASRYKNVMTPTQRRVAAIVQMTLVVLFIFAPLLLVAGYRLDATFVDIVRNTLVFSTSLVPQGLILVITLSLAIGAVNISRHQTLVQRVNAVESMANVSVLCFDKTGTITQNKLVVEEIITLDDSVDVQGDLAAYIGNLANLNSTAAAIARHLHPEGSQDTSEIVMMSSVEKEYEIPFNSARKWGAVVLPERVLLLGAPERVFGSAYAERVAARSERGLRVLAFAESDEIPQEDAIDTTRVRPLALIAIQDQIRDDIRDTLAAFREQNVKLKVISGDSLLTVKSIAQQAGMDVDVVYTGDQLDEMSDSELDQAVREADVFARVEPDTKRRIISALRWLGNHVAMVGDGVNDVPALKAADLAIVMNDGAQISKDIAEIVLLNNAMSTLPKAFHEGTTITQKIYGTTKMFLTKNVYNTVLFIFVMCMALPFPITPIQISWAAFGTINIVGGLIALGLIRPAWISNFRDDVMDYMITTGLTGAVGMALMYLVTLNYVDDLLVARSTMTLFFILYSMTITWNVHGADVTQPLTVFENFNIVWSTLLLSGLALGAATLLPDLFEFQWPPPEILLLLGLLHVLCVWISSIGLRNRGLLHQFYKLVQR